MFTNKTKWIWILGFLAFIALLIFIYYMTRPPQVNITVQCPETLKNDIVPSDVGALVGMTKKIKFRNGSKPKKINKGEVYLLRNASHDKNIFKIGFTKRDSDTRSEELSQPTGVPDKFLIAGSWEVSDCTLAEKRIHEKLDEYRVNPKREFFKIDYALAMKEISAIVNNVNTNKRIPKLKRKNFELTA